MATETKMVELELATPTGLKLQTRCHTVEAPSTSGEFGVLSGHLPMMASLETGVLKFRNEANELVVAAIGPGFAQTEPNKVLILTDSYVAAGDIDATQAKSDLEQANEAIKTFEGRHEGSDFDELARNLDWARAQLNALKLSAN